MIHRQFRELIFVVLVLHVDFSALSYIRSVLPYPARYQSCIAHLHKAMSNCIIHLNYTNSNCVDYIWFLYPLLINGVKGLSFLRAYAARMTKTSSFPNSKSHFFVDWKSSAIALNRNASMAFIKEQQYNHQQSMLVQIILFKLTEM